MLALLAKTPIILHMEQTTSRVSVWQRPVKWGIVLTAGLLLIGWLFNTPTGLLGKADAVGYAVCHRIDARSFHLGNRQLPLCVRCTGMYLGAMWGLAFQVILGRRRGGIPSWRVWGILGVLVIAFGVDGLNSYAHLIPAFHLPSLYEPQNWLRLLTGTGMGLVMMVALFPVFNQTVWRDWENKPALVGWQSWSVLFGVALLLDGIVLTENPLVLYPLALISTGGVLVILTMVYTMIWLMILRRENRITRFAQLTFPLVGGFAVTLLQIIVLDLIRYWLTGTWGGLSLG
jgi:uncharacterized membrane protein